MFSFAVEDALGSVIFMAAVDFAYCCEGMT